MHNLRPAHEQAPPRAPPDPPLSRPLPLPRVWCGAVREESRGKRKRSFLISPDKRGIPLPAAPCHAPAPCVAGVLFSRLGSRGVHGVAQRHRSGARPPARPPALRPRPRRRRQLHVRSMNKSAHNAGAHRAPREDRGGEEADVAAAGAAWGTQGFPAPVLSGRATPHPSTHPPAVATRSTASFSLPLSSSLFLSLSFSLSFSLSSHVFPPPPPRAQWAVGAVLISNFVVNIIERFRPHAPPLP